MAKPIRRERVPAHLVCVDTNILFATNKALVVSPEFEKFWSNHSARFDLSLVVPEVVKGELLFQQTIAARKCLESARAELEKSSNIADAAYSVTVTDTRVKRDVAKKLEKWLVRIRAEVAETPISKIDWPAIIESSVWRKPPFVSDSNTPHVEKGFRDAMILETALAICRSAKASQKIAFISKDKILLGAFSTKTDKNEFTDSFESLEEFAGYLRLTEEELTAEFVKSIQRKAALKFFKLGDERTLYFTAGVYQSAKGKFGETFSQPSEPVSLGGLGLIDSSRAKWQPRSSEKIWISGARFDHLEGDRHFHWRNRVTFVQLFSRYSYPDHEPGSLLFTQEHRARIVEIDVCWVSLVKSDARFYGLKITDLIEVSSSFEQPTQDQINQFKLQGMMS